jgi:hypothetical protein
VAVVNHSLPSSAGVKNAWSCTSTPPICLLGMERDKFTLFIPRYLDGF